MLGVVLAGGESRRMGRDKAFLEADGEPLWKRQVGVLRDAGAGRVVLIRRRGQDPVAYDDCHFDVFTGCGPLAGIHAALEIGGHPHVGVLAVDMPGIDAAWFGWLGGFCKAGVGAVARGDRALEPLAAIYPAEALPEAALRLERGGLVRPGARPRAGRGGTDVHRRAPRRVRRAHGEPQPAAGLTQRAPSLLLLTTASMKAMPSTPSSIVGKSSPRGIARPSTSASMARNASR